MTSKGRAVADEQAPAARRRRKRRLGMVVAVATVAVEAAALATKGYRSVTDIVVRCRQGHLSTTTWIPGVSFKAARLGWFRLQRCPVGQHWSLVAPVDERRLSDEEREQAHSLRDSRVP